MWMLSVGNWLSEGGFSLLEQKRIPAMRHCGGFETQHRACRENPWSERTAVDTVKTGAQLLKVACDCDEQVMRGVPFAAVLFQMADNLDYRPAFIGALQKLQVEEANSETRWLKLAQIKPGMIVGAGIYSQTGLLLLAKGQQITDSAMARLNSFASLFGVIEPISVVVPQSAQNVTPVPPQEPGETLRTLALR